MIGTVTASKGEKGGYWTKGLRERGASEKGGKNKRRREKKAKKKKAPYRTQSRRGFGGCKKGLEKQLSRK